LPEKKNMFNANQQEKSRQYVQNLVAKRKQGFSLEAPFYLSDDVFESDMRLIFGKHWLYVGTEANIREPGDYFTADFGPYSIIVLRGDDMQIAAFHNVCRHRGARLLQDQQGSVGNIVCPYHQWTYASDGALLHAELQVSADKRCLSLKDVHVRSLSGLVFVCVADVPPDDFDELARIVEPYMEPHRLQDCKVAKQVDIIENGNWKLTLENNRECYHCLGHPELLQSTFGVFGYTEADADPSRREALALHNEALKECKATWDHHGLPYECVEHLDDRITGFRFDRNALAGPGESMTMDGRVASKRLLGNLSNARLGRFQFHLQPNSWHHLQSDHTVHFSVLPISPGKTLLRTTWLVHQDAIEGVDYDLENLTYVWEKTNDQDRFYVALTQEGALNPAYEPGPYAPSEWQVEKFCNWYINRLSALLDA
jgi:Rieske 2Fe-2S family protein